MVLQDLPPQTMMNKTFEGRPLGLFMGGNRNVVIFVSLLLQLLMVGATAAPLAIVADIRSRVIRGIEIAWIWLDANFTAHAPRSIINVEQAGTYQIKSVAA